jgi:PA14 domain/Proprotein convertase P-domain
VADCASHVTPPAPALAYTDAMIRRLWRLAPLSIALASACAFDASGLDASSTITDDNATDFGAAGATLEGAEIDGGGFITPLAYVTGAALVHGASTQVFTGATGASWDAIAATTPSGTALAAPLGALGKGYPPGLGLTSGDKWTFWLEGEVWLEAGTHTFSLLADDTGFLDLAAPGSSQYTRVVADNKTGTTGTFDAAADGWYGVHMALSENGGDAGYVLLHQAPNATGLTPFDPDRLRYPVADLHGLVTDAFDGYFMQDAVGRSLLGAAVLDQDFGATIPPDSGITQAGSYSLHWAGQVLVDTTGNYAFQLDTDDGHRLRVDDQLVLDDLVKAPRTETTGPVHLEPGWHDLVIEQTQYGSTAHAKLSVASGPEFAGGPIPLDHTRPLVPRTDRVAGTSDDSDRTFAALGSGTYDLTPQIPAGAVVVGVDADYGVNHPHMTDLEVSVMSPDGSTAVLRQPGDTDHGGSTYESRATHDLDGKDAAGTWHLTVTDTAGTSGGNTLAASITVHYTGGKPPIPPIASYDSAVHDLGAPSIVDQVTWSASTPTGTSVAVRVRACPSADAGACASTPWSDPVASGDAPSIGTAELLQYRVELSSDGDQAAAFSSISISYRTAR